MEWLADNVLGLIILGWIVVTVARWRGADAPRPKRPPSAGSPPSAGPPPSASRSPSARPTRPVVDEQFHREDAAFLDGYIFYRYYHDEFGHHDVDETDALADAGDDDWGDAGDDDFW